MAIKDNIGFGLFIADYKGIGSYDLAIGNDATYTTNPLDPTNATYMSTRGAVTIISITEREINGTFEFKSLNYETQKEKTITEGEFSVKLVASPKI